MSWAYLFLHAIELFFSSISFFGTLRAAYLRHAICHTIAKKPTAASIDVAFFVFQRAKYVFTPNAYSHSHEQHRTCAAASWRAL